MNTVTRKISFTLLWVVISALLLVVGAASALVVIDPSLVSLITGGGPPRAAVAPAPQPPPPAAVEPATPGARSYRVREGENLWAIARKSGLVDSPWEWRTIVNQNRSQIDYAFIAENSGDWKVIVEKGRRLTVGPEPPRAAVGPVRKKFALQLISVPAARRDRAVEIVQALLNGGTFAYFYGAEVAGQAVYRVRAGFFENRRAAQAAGDRIREQARKEPLLPRHSFVVVPSDRELRGDLFEFGIQRTKPWVLEFPARETHREAVTALKQIAAPETFPYIAQKRDGKTGEFSYHVRVGYFRSRALADAFRAGHQAQREWHAARAVSLNGFSEALPGQNMKMKPPRS